ncbi:MAG: prohibitin family protein [Flavobacteriales bacterium]
MKKYFLVIIGFIILNSCTEVENGYKGVVYQPYAGGLDPSIVYPEGVDIGVSWLWNDMITYDCRQHTTDIKANLLDVNNMSVGITASVFHRVIPNKIGYLHLEKGQDYEQTYIKPVFEGALKNVIGKYTAQELVSSKRDAVEKEIKSILDQAFKVNYIQCDDIIIRDVNLPEAINKAITAKQVQEEQNLLAEKKKVEKENLAAAIIAEAKGNYEAAQYDAKTKDIMSHPKMLKLKELEIQEKAIERWNGEFGNNNVFSEVPVIRGLGGIK